MDGLFGFWGETDAVGRAVALLLLLMSVSSWMLILWKAWVLRRAGLDIGQSAAAFWQAPNFAEGRSRLAGVDRESVLLPLVDALGEAEPDGSLGRVAGEPARLTRLLRQALHRSLSHLRFGQVLLASIGSTAPFVGLFGTVWGIYHALVSMTASGNVGIEAVAGPVGEALIMTAAGLAVAIPAVLAYNFFGKWVGQAEAELEGWAQDLLDYALKAR